MSNFKYIKEGNEVFMVLGEDRSRAKWKARFVPEAEQIIIVPTAVALNKSTLSLKEGASEKLTASLTPEGAQASQLKWSSSDPSKATVAQDGTVTAVAAGEATISVCSEWDASAKDDCVVTVTKK